MTPGRILEINALFTGVSAVGLLAFRRTLHPLFGLETPLLLDIVAVGLLAYVALLIAGARQQPVHRQTLLAFAIADAAWVAGSAVVVLLFWQELAPVARGLVIAAALAVDVFATAQFRAAGRAPSARALPRSAAL